MKLFRTGAVVLLFASLALSAQEPIPAPSKLNSSLLERSGHSPTDQVVVHLLLSRTALYRASSESNAARAAARRGARSPDLLADAAAARVQFASRAAELLAADADTIATAVTAVGGRVLYRALASADIIAVVPAAGLPRLAVLPQVNEIVEDVPLQGGLEISGSAIGAGAFWSAGEDGSNVKVGIIDSGVDLTNPVFNGVAAQSSVYLAAAPVADSCFADSVSPDDIQGHGTHVAGIVFSRGASQCTACKGIASGAQLWILKAGYKSSCSATPSMRWSDTQSAVSDSAAVQVYNMSYGTPTTCDTSSTKYACDDDGVSRAWDTTVDTRGQAATICAGNDGLNGGTNTLWAPAIAYNVMSVANVDDRGTVDRSDDAVYTSSSYGPTSGGRKKPDIAAPGRSINSANYNWEAGPQFARMTGTSMAAPHVAGAMALLLNAAATENIPALLDPRSLKAVLINSAELRNGITTWEPHWGWGYLNAASAYQHRKAVFLDAVTAGSARLYAGSTLGNSGKATLVWNRHPTNVYTCPTGTLPLNNLDLFAYDEADGSTLAVSASTVDNVEQVIAQGKSTAVLRVVSVCGGFTGSEQYGLATENGFMPAAPALRLRIPPQNMVAGGQGTVSVEAYNDGNVAAQNVKVTLSVPLGMSFQTGLPTVTIARLAANSSTVLSWQVATPIKEGFYAASASATSTSYGMDLSAATVQNWSVGNIANFVLTLARPTRALRPSSTPAIVAGQARTFEIVASGISAADPVETRCDTPDGVECTVTKAADDHRRLIVTLRPSVTTEPAAYSATITVASDSGRGTVELPFQVRARTSPARTRGNKRSLDSD